MKVSKAAGAKFFVLRKAMRELEGDLSTEEALKLGHRSAELQQEMAQYEEDRAAKLAELNAQKKKIKEEMERVSRALLNGRIARPIEVEVRADFSAGTAWEVGPDGETIPDSTRPLTPEERAAAQGSLVVEGGQVTGTKHLRAADDQGQARERAEALFTKDGKPDEQPAAASGPKPAPSSYVLPPPLERYSVKRFDAARLSIYEEGKSIGDGEWDQKSGIFLHTDPKLVPGKVVSAAELAIRAGKLPIPGEPPASPSSATESTAAPESAPAAEAPLEQAPAAGGEGGDEQPDPKAPARSINDNARAAIKVMARHGAPMTKEKIGTATKNHRPGTTLKALAAAGLAELTPDGWQLTAAGWQESGVTPPASAPTKDQAAPTRGELPAFTPDQAPTGADREGALLGELTRHLKRAGFAFNTDIAPKGGWEREGGERVIVGDGTGHVMWGKGKKPAPLLTLEQARDRAAELPDGPKGDGKGEEDIPF